MESYNIFYGCQVRLTELKVDMATFGKLDGAEGPAKEGILAQEEVKHQNKFSICLDNFPFAVVIQIFI